MSNLETVNSIVYRRVKVSGLSRFVYVSLLVREENIKLKNIIILSIYKVIVKKPGQYCAFEQFRVIRNGFKIHFCKCFNDIRQEHR